MPKAGERLLTDDDIRLIVRLRVAGFTYAELVNATGHCNDTIHGILLDHGLAGTYNTKPKPEPEELFAEEAMPLMFACSKCGFRALSKQGHENCQRRRF